MKINKHVIKDIINQLRLEIRVHRLNIVIATSIIVGVLCISNIIAKIYLLTTHKYKILNKGILANNVMLLISVFAVSCTAIGCIVPSIRFSSKRSPLSSSLAITFNISATTLIIASAVIYSIILSRKYDISSEFIKKTSIALLIISSVVLTTAAAYVYRSKRQRCIDMKLIFCVALCTAIATIVASSLTLSDSSKIILAIEIPLLTTVIGAVFCAIYMSLYYKFADKIIDPGVIRTDTDGNRLCIHANIDGQIPFYATNEGDRAIYIMTDLSAEKVYSKTNNPIKLIKEPSMLDKIQNACIFS